MAASTSRSPPGLRWPVQRYIYLYIYISPLSVPALQSRLCLSYLAYITHNGSTVTWTVVRLTAAKFKLLIFSVCWLRSAPVCTDFPFLQSLMTSACCLHNLWRKHAHMKLWQPHYIADWCAPWTVPTRAGNMTSFLSKGPDFPMSIAMFERSQASSVCPSGKSSMDMTMYM